MCESGTNSEVCQGTSVSVSIVRVELAQDERSKTSDDEDETKAKEMTRNAIEIREGKAC